MSRPQLPRECSSWTGRHFGQSGFSWVAGVAGVNPNVPVSSLAGGFTGVPAGVTVGEDVKSSVSYPDVFFGNATADSNVPGPLAS